MGQTTSSTAPSLQAVGGCPIKHDKAPIERPAECPVPHPSSASSSQRPAECPITHERADSSTALSPHNQMPSLAQSPAVGQQTALPTKRTTSSIPRASDGGVWEYPSPQQFYNALVRKGWETPEEHVEMMVHIHNFLNERAWNEVIRWERRRDSAVQIELARFRGRPGEFSPKARLYMFAGWLLPTRFNTEPPFDRHDWIVRRRTTGEEVRYVIDYYSLPDKPDGSPVFSLDVRPALDSVGSVKERILAATEETWTSLKEKQDNNRERERESSRS